MPKINEAINITTKKSNHAKYAEVDINTPFVKEMIKEMASKQGKDVNALTLELQDKIDKQIEQWKDKPDSFFAPSRKNIIESFLFDMADFSEAVFDEKTFYYLFDVILAKNKTFLKIVNPITGKRLKLNIILTPQPSFIKQPDWVKSVTTAAASPEGDIIFNLDFCKKLIGYSEAKGIVPKGGHYVSNGGKVPDSYSYIEFLILHEIYHIVHADHFFQSQKKGMTGKMQNYLGDFITNYNLVKNGYDQLPIGLYSDTYNYDNYISMDAMQNDIIKDFEALSEKDKEDMDNQQNDHMDENHDKKDDQEGDGDPDNQQGEDSEDSEDSQDGEGEDSEDGEPQDGDPDNQQAGEAGEPQEQKSNDENIDDAFNKTDEDLKDADDGMSQKEIDDAIEKMKEEEGQADQEASDKRKESLEQAEQERKDKIDAKLENLKEGEPIRWEMLIKKMIPKAISIEEETITKMHKRTRGRLAMGDDMVAVKAGTRSEDDTSQSLLFILDSSGSMASTIQGVSVELLKLINKSMTNGIKDMWIIRFDSKYRVYRINLDLKKKKHTYQELNSPKDLLATKDLSKIKIDDDPKPIKKLFQLSWGGGTDFPRDIFLIIKKFLKEDFNQVLFTDSDITSTANIKNLAKACKIGKSKKFSFNVILNNKSTYNTVKELLGGTYKYMTYLSNSDI